MPLIVLVGCGDPLADERFLGAPLWQLHVDTGASESGRLQDASDLRLALFFSPGGPQVTDLERHVEQASTSRPAALPQGLTLNVFEPPGKDLFAAGASYAVGRIVAYLDSNRDGRRSAGEPFVGLWVPGAILYAPRALAAGETPTSGPVTQGFHPLLLQQTCGKLPQGPRTPGTCGVPLGQPCNHDDECGPGFCLLSTGMPWLNGSCAVTEPPRDGCRPQDASYYPLGSGMGPTGVYLRRCQRDEDCRRPQDGAAGLYRCDDGLLGCVPSGPAHVTVGGKEQPQPLCPN